jgi:hypothetical protein
LGERTIKKIAEQNRTIDPTRLQIRFELNNSKDLHKYLKQLMGIQATSPKDLKLINLIRGMLQAVIPQEPQSYAKPEVVGRLLLMVNSQVGVRILKYLRAQIGKDELLFAAEKKLESVAKARGGKAKFFIIGTKKSFSQNKFMAAVEVRHPEVVRVDDHEYSMNGHFESLTHQLPHRRSTFVARQTLFQFIHDHQTDEDMMNLFRGDLVVKLRHLHTKDGILKCEPDILVKNQMILRRVAEDYNGAHFVSQTLFAVIWMEPSTQANESMAFNSLKKLMKFYTFDGVLKINWDKWKYMFWHWANNFRPLLSSGYHQVHDDTKKTGDNELVKSHDDSSWSSEELGF